MGKFFNQLEEKIAVLCLAVMTLLTFTNVVSRYVFKASLSFSEEITTNLFVLLTLLGASIAAKKGAHLGVTIITDRLNAKAKKTVTIIGLLLAALFSGVLFYFGLLMVSGELRLGQVTATMQWPEWIFGSFVPIGALILFIRYALLLTKAIKEEV